jgi:hypothetical protein
MAKLHGSITRRIVAEIEEIRTADAAELAAKVESDWMEALHEKYVRGWNARKASAAGGPLRRFEFAENNSGGRWWLGRKEYDALLASGWVVSGKPSPYDGVLEDWVGGGGVPYHWRNGMTVMASSIEEAIDRWEVATGRNPHAEGCDCCGPPYEFYERE